MDAIRNYNLSICTLFVKRIIWHHQYSLCHLYLRLVLASQPNCLIKRQKRKIYLCNYSCNYKFRALSLSVQLIQLGYCHAADIFNGETTICFFAKCIRSQGIDFRRLMSNDHFHVKTFTRAIHFEIFLDTDDRCSKVQNQYTINESWKMTTQKNLVWWFFSSHQCLFNNFSNINLRIHLMYEIFHFYIFRDKKWVHLLFIRLILSGRMRNSGERKSRIQPLTYAWNLSGSGADPYKQLDFLW